MEQGVRTQMFKPKVTETKLWNLHNLFLAFFIGVCLVVLATAIMIILGLSLINSIVVDLIIIVIYAVILFFLLEPRILREIETTIVQTIEKSIIQKVPLIKEVFIERPVYRNITNEVERPVYVSVPKKKLYIPKYDFVASNLTKVYHKHSCRLGRSIKRSHKISTNSEIELKKKGFRPCKVCITKKKKA